MSKLTAKDLMIGDLVLYGKRYAIIKRIGYSRVTLLCGDELDDETYDNIEPIPLTPEILEKNGFERILQSVCIEPYRWELAKYENDIKVQSKLLYHIKADNTLFRGMFVSIYNPSDCEAISFCKQVEFVHQLQHALKLCGIKKEIYL